METTLFCHFLNEEILLPSWLGHHKKLFSHGVMLNWGSTDKSVNIIREICPNWEIVEFGKNEIRSEEWAMRNKIQQLESMKTGWKCALNVSEYLIIDNLERYILNLEQNNKDIIGIRTTGVIIVDEPEDKSIESFKNENLLCKKKFGYLEYGKAWDKSFHSDGKIRTVLQDSEHYEGFRGRLLHKSIHGDYKVGRHGTNLRVEKDPELYLAWIGCGSPLYYNYRVSHWKELNQAAGRPNFHAVDFGALGIDFYEKLWRVEYEKSTNLFDNIPKYKMYLDELYNNVI